MLIYLATDHAGFKLKEAVKKWLVDNGYEVKDCGAFEYKKRDDYPDFVKKAVREIATSLPRVAPPSFAKGYGRARRNDECKRLTATRLPYSRHCEGVAERPKQSPSSVIARERRSDRSNLRRPSLRAHHSRHCERSEAISHNGEGIAQALPRNDGSARGIIFGGSGQGEAMVANRYKGIRAVVYYGPPRKIITLSREHNDANVLSLAGFFLSQKEAIKAVELWLKTPFSKAVRHKRRVRKIK